MGQMKRSKINQCIREMEALIREHGFALPPFCHWTPEEWKEKGEEYDEIRDNMLGWDITDYGQGDFDKCGFSLITIRNGNQNNPKYKKVYAEKLLMLKEGQHSPMHFHWKKSEDIINRGGGTLIIHLYNDDGEGGLADTDVTVNSDGRSYQAPAGTGVRLHPGESITLWPHQYHDFDRRLHAPDPVCQDRTALQSQPSLDRLSLLLTSFLRSFYPPPTCCQGEGHNRC